jgi:hypothetical protein
MGINQSVEELPVFEPVAAAINSPLRLDELWELTVPLCVREVDLKNISVLFQMDEDKDGFFSKSDIISFAEMINLEARGVPEYRLAKRIIGLCSCHLIQILQEQGGIECMFNYSPTIFVRRCDELDLQISRCRR